MKPLAHRLALFALLLIFLAAAAGGAEQVADEHDSCEHQHTDSEHEHANGHPDQGTLTTARGHIHAPGVRNHGTEWLFSQPWAAPSIWNKMLRDSAILLVLAAAIYAISTRIARSE